MRLLSRHERIMMKKKMKNCFLLSYHLFAARRIIQHHSLLFSRCHHHSAQITATNTTTSAVLVDAASTATKKYLYHNYHDLHLMITLGFLVLNRCQASCLLQQTIRRKLLLYLHSKKQQHFTRPSIIVGQTVISNLLQLDEAPRV